MTKQVRGQMHGQKHKQPAGLKPVTKGKQKYRTIWISDTHLGSYGVRADALLDFLQCTQSDMLYLVGDIIDGWQLRKRWYWPPQHNTVIQRILRIATRGTRVYYIPGNHDDMMRQFIGLSFGDITIHADRIHTTADGKKLWVVHGDLFDNVIQHWPWLAYIGGQFYVMLLVSNRFINAIQRFFNLPYWSFSQYLKHKVKSAVSHLSAFENALETEAKRQNATGVVCGHIHKPRLNVKHGFIYANDGDWVESMTALVEHFDGRLEIIAWKQVWAAKQAQKRADRRAARRRGRLAKKQAA